MSATGSDSSQSLPPLASLTMLVAGASAMLLWALVWGPRSGLAPRALIAVGSLLLALPTLLLVALRRSHTWRSTLALPSPDRNSIALSVLLGASLWVFSIGIMELQSLVAPPSPEDIEYFRAIHRALAPDNALDALVSIFVIALAPAVAEEIVMRGSVLPSLIGWFGRPGAILASAGLFGLMHPDLRLLFTFAVGVILGAVRLRAGSLWPAIVAHATLNTLTFLIAPLVDDPTQTVYVPQPALGVAALLAGMALTLPLLKALRRDGAAQTAGPLC